MSNNKQSSVDFLFQNMFELSQTLVTSGETQYELMMQVYQQAKAMHKEEITQAWKKGDGHFDNVAKKMSLDYYNKKFGGNNEQS